jgi:transcriptional regulator with XRE-family HTH domain
LIPAFLRRQRNQRRLTLANLYTKVGMSPQHLSEIESGKRDPRLSSIERMAEGMGMAVLIVPEAMAPELRRYIANNGRTYTTKPFSMQPVTSQPSTPPPQRTRPPPPQNPPAPTMPRKKPETDVSVQRAHIARAHDFGCRLGSNNSRLPVMWQ